MLRLGLLSSLAIILLFGCCPKPIENTRVETREVVLPVPAINDTLDAMWWDGFNYARKKLSTNIVNADTTSYGEWYGYSIKDKDTIAKVTFSPSKQQFGLQVKPPPLQYKDTTIYVDRMKIIKETDSSLIAGAFVAGGLFIILLCVLLRRL